MGVGSHRRNTATVLRGGVIQTHTAAHFEASRLLTLLRVLNALHSLFKSGKNEISSRGGGLQRLHFPRRYGYGERVQQDETFADMILQRISMLQYSTLYALVNASPQLRDMLPHLPSGFGEPFFLVDNDESPANIKGININVSTSCT